VAFGASLIWEGVTVADGRTLAFAAIALAARTILLLPVLALAGVERRDRWLIALFGPRGLSSLLLVLLPVFAGIPGGGQLFAITCLVVLLSVVIHGGGIALYLQHGRRAASRESQVTLPAPVGAASKGEGRTPGATPKEEVVEEKITLDEVQALMAAGAPMILADVRTDRSYRDDDLQAVGAIRLPPDDAVRVAREKRLSQHATLVLYCA
jgi:sodium/hydrogen antiporter